MTRRSQNFASTAPGACYGRVALGLRALKLPPSATDRRSENAGQRIRRGAGRLEGSLQCAVRSWRSRSLPRAAVARSRKGWRVGYEILRCVKHRSFNGSRLKHLHSMIGDSSLIRPLNRDAETLGRNTWLQGGWGPVVLKVT